MSAGTIYLLYKFPEPKIKCSHPVKNDAQQLLKILIQLDVEKGIAGIITDFCCPKKGFQTFEHQLIVMAEYMHCNRRVAKMDQMINVRDKFEEMLKIGKDISNDNIFNDCIY